MSQKMMKGTKRHHTFATSASAWLLVACVLSLCVFATGVNAQIANASVTDNASRMFYMHKGRHANKAPAEAEHRRAIWSGDAHVATWSDSRLVSDTGVPFPGFTCQEQSP